MAKTETSGRQIAIDALRPFAVLAESLNGCDLPALKVRGLVVLSIGDKSIVAADLNRAATAIKILEKGK